MAEAYSRTPRLRLPGNYRFRRQDPWSKRRYAHHGDVWSYKLDYGQLFASLPHFVLAEKISYSHSGDAGDSFSFDPQERVESWVLAKDHENAYADPFPGG